MPASSAAAAEATLDDRRRSEHQDLRADGRRMLTVAEVAPFVHGDEDYVRKLIREGALPATQRTPRKTLVCEADVYAFLHPRRS